MLQSLDAKLVTRLRSDFRLPARWLRVAFFALQVSLFNTFIAAQSTAKALTQYSLDVWQTENGLPQNSVQTIVQTRDGYIWIGTQEGLVRFDGVRFTVFDKRNTKELQHNSIQRLLETRDGKLWIATNGGLLMYLKGKFTAYSTQDGLSNSTVYSLAEDRDGNLWVGTFGGGVNKFKDGKFTSYTTKDGLANNFVWSIVEGQNGALWFGTNGGLSRLQDGQFITYNKASGLPHEVVWTVREARDQSLWLGTSGGVAHFQNGRFTNYTKKDGLTHDVVKAVIEDKEGSLWIGTDGGGLNRYANGKFASFTSKEGLSNDFIWEIFQDYEGSIWLGTYGGGLNRLRDGKFLTYTTKEGLANDHIRAIYEGRDGSVWIGAIGGGLTRLKDGQFTYYSTKNGLANDLVLTVTEDRAGHIWVGSNGGLSQLKAGRIKNYSTKDGLSHDYVRAIYEDRNGVLWIGTRGGGLDLFQNGKFTSLNKVAGFPSDAVRIIYEDQQGQLWIGSNGGLSLWQNGSFKTYTTKDGLSLDAVYDIHQDQSGTMWIATYGGGLNRFKDGKFTKITSQNGLYDDVIFRLLEDNQQNFWMSCNRGIFRVSKQALNDFADGKIPSIISTAYTVADGMRSSECNGSAQHAGYKTQDGRLWFPTLKGVVVVDPANLKTNQMLPPVVIESVLIDQQSIDYSLPFQADPGKGQLEFHYAALCYQATNKVKFKYLLEGFDQDWIDAGTRRVAYYTNIPPGEYRFRVIACNNDGLWNEVGASWQFRLQPHFYQTVPFYALCGLGGILLLGAGYQLRFGSLQRRELELERKVEEQTRALRQQQALVEEQKTFLRRVIDVIPSFIFVKDQEGRFLLANQSLARSYGTTVDDILGKTDADFNSHPEQVEKFRRDDLEVMESKTEKLMVEEFTDVNGESRWVQVNKLPVCSEYGVVQGLVGVATDITLQQKIAIELQRAKDAAEAATKAKSEFLANMSHEIRTPMNAVIGMTGLLLDTPLNEEQRDFVETVRTSSDALLTIINDILDFSKIESGKLDLEEQPFCLTDCIEEALDLLANKASEKGLDLAYWLDEKTPHTIRGDITRLRQILVNLVSNAVKFTAHGEVVITVTSRQLPDQRYELRFAVKDTGIGIPRDRMDRLFRSFSQVDSSTTRNFGGTGLGLVISKRLSELMGGTMWVESEEGVGSTFYFTVEATSAPTPQRVYQSGAQPQLAGKQLLIVDDNETNRRILTLQTQSWGMVTETCASAAEALDRLRENSNFEVAILDWHMPEQDGVSLAKEILRQPATKDLPLVMLSSGAVSRKSVERETNVKFAAFLSKPIKPSQLFDVLMQVFGTQFRPVKPSVSPRLDQRLATRLPLRLLLVEDNAVNQKVALRILQQMGYRADVAGNGVEALEAVRRQTYDLVLMDVHMPEMDGLTAARTICAEYDSVHRPKIVAMTANAMKEDREACLAAGMDDYISKPIRVEELQAALERWGEVIVGRQKPDTAPAMTKD